LHVEKDANEAETSQKLFPAVFQCFVSILFQNVWMSEIKHCCRWSAENEQNFISECVTVPLVFLEI